ncbi:MAG: FKBP-type peptidyl-prolyl cis-trans isomerase [Muribaculaceae bacterium]|nr:FKBP-type peptidyl-prolyl cis-trans isomerase [Muribaculaceae bacterium]
MNLMKFTPLACFALLLSTASCIKDDPEESYADWRAENEEYIANAEKSGKYQKITPDWDKTSFVLMDWIRRGDNPNKIKPLDNSTVDVVYLLTNIEGDTLDSSFSRTDSLYRIRPDQTCTGFRIALTNMNIGDSVEAVMPYFAGYGAYGSGSVLPFSTLIFQIKLVDIPALEKEP